MAIPRQYVNGSKVTVRAVFRDDDGALFDPTVVIAKYATPANAVTSLTYPTTIVKDAVGLYHLDITVNRAGDWRYRWQGDDAAVEGRFRVKPSIFSP